MTRAEKQLTAYESKIAAVRSLTDKYPQVGEAADFISLVINPVITVYWINNPREWCATMPDMNWMKRRANNSFEYVGRMGDVEVRVAAAEVFTTPEPKEEPLFT